MAKKLTKTEKKKLAQDIIMEHLATIGYGKRYEEYIDAVGDMDEADSIMMEQMNRVAKIMGYKNAWFG